MDNSFKHPPSETLRRLTWRTAETAQPGQRPMPMKFAFTMKLATTRPSSLLAQQ